MTVCDCIKAQLTRLHSALLVTEPCSKTAAQLEHWEMEEYVNPKVTGKENTHEHILEINQTEIPRSRSTLAVAPALCLLLKCPEGDTESSPAR